MAETPIDYQLLAIFVAVAELSSFSKAARKLGIGKGTVSRAIARLEAEVGAELLHRTTHEVALSTAGQTLYERTAPHLTALQEAVLQLPERAEQPSGELRLTAPSDFGAIVLPEILGELARRYPEMSYDVRLTNERVDLVAQGFDLAIRAGPSAMKDSTLTVRRLGAVVSALYAAPSYLARRGRPKQPHDSGHDWILHPFALAAWKLKRQAAKFVCDDFFVIRELVRQGAGIGVLPSFVADAYVREGWIESVQVGKPTLAAGSYVMLYPSRGQVPRKVAAFRDHLIQRLKKTPLG
ncbi:MAG: LysR substrate-binding domain-containing protein [Polyangiales bacterium]